MIKYITSSFKIIANSKKFSGLSSRNIYAAEQSQKLVKFLVLLTLIACLLHIFIGSDLLIIAIGWLAFSLSLSPVASLGILNLSAILIAIVGFRYIGFPIFAKLAFLQHLNSNLYDPLGTFLTFSIGILGYLAAFKLSNKIGVGKPILKTLLSNRQLNRILIYSAIIGIIANVTVAYRIHTQYIGVTIAEHFINFINLSLITAIARTILNTNGRRSIDLVVIILFILKIEFAVILNSRMAIMEAFLCWIMTTIAFEVKLKLKHLIASVFAVSIMIIFITPLFLYLRGIRDDLSWVQRLSVTAEAINDRQETFDYYSVWKQVSDRVGWYKSYYGDSRNVLERMSHINNVDILKNGSDIYGKVGFLDIQLSLIRAMPRFLASDKPIGYSQGSWLYQNLGIANPGPYPTAPLIGNGYASFGWIGAFVYPFFFSIAWLIFIKKSSGLNLQKNIWVVYFFVRIHNHFVEGASDTYIAYTLRTFPQDLIILYIISSISKINIIRSLPLQRSRDTFNLKKRSLIIKKFRDLE